MDKSLKITAILTVAFVACFMMGCLTIQGINGIAMMGVAVAAISLIEAIVLGVKNGIQKRKADL